MTPIPSGALGMESLREAAARYRLRFVVLYREVIEKDHYVNPWAWVTDGDRRVLPARPAPVRQRLPRGDHVRRQDRALDVHHAPRDRGIADRELVAPDEKLDHWLRGPRRNVRPSSRPILSTYAGSRRPRSPRFTRGVPLTASFARPETHARPLHHAGHVRRRVVARDRHRLLTPLRGRAERERVAAGDVAREPVAIPAIAPAGSSTERARLQELRSAVARGRALLAEWHDLDVTSNRAGSRAVTPRPAVA